MRTMKSQMKRMMIRTCLITLKTIMRGKVVMRRRRTRRILKMKRAQC